MDRGDGVTVRIGQWLENRRRGNRACADRQLFHSADTRRGRHLTGGSPVSTRLQCWSSYGIDDLLASGALSPYRLVAVIGLVLNKDVEGTDAGITVRAVAKSGCMLRVHVYLRLGRKQRRGERGQHPHQRPRNVARYKTTR